jgi:hypothetical protein
MASPGYGQWLFALVAASIVVKLAVVYVAMSNAEDADGGPAPASEAASETVECSTCGTENAASFRYCRDCGGDLPGELRP